MAIGAAMVILPFLSLEAKEKSGVIMTIDGEEIPTEEFLYLFEKNNQQQSQPQTLDEYLELFEIYRLKVAEAKSQGVDTTENFRKETDLYRRELLEPYVADTVFFNALVEEAAAREKYQVESSHIMMIRTHNEETDKRNLEILDSLRTEILNGADFIDLAKQYSQDKFSSAKGGYLGFTPAGTFPYGFETAVYETPEGEISEIVESHVGWHIVRAGSKKPSFEFNQPEKTIAEVKADVTRKAGSPFDPRYHKLRKNLIDKLKLRHKGVKVENMSDDDAYNALLTAEEEEQYRSNPEYRNLVDEYVNGSLLYEVSVENVWNPAANDIEGLEAYYAAHRDNYKWEKSHAKGFLVQAKNDSVGQLIKERIAGMPSDSIVPIVRKDFKGQAIIERFNVSEGSNPMIDNLMFGGAPASPRVKNFETFFVVDANIVEEPEGLEDVKGAVVNDYQEELEKQWVSNLRQKHAIQVNRKELANIRKNIR